jgi:hypothetical protein
MAVIEPKKSLLASACLQAIREAQTERLAVRFMVEPSGVVSHVNVEGTNAALADCVRRELSTWIFPSAAASTQVNVPFVFQGARK